ncbi:hypothetical protein HDV00_011975 [Rhizophlyctis rosea]|nr:hypothetical protein HDV00_011975 [Rhizophlyctis rosea]
MFGKSNHLQHHPLRPRELLSPDADIAFSFSDSSPPTTIWDFPPSPLPLPTNPPTTILPPPTPTPLTIPELLTQILSHTSTSTTLTCERVSKLWRETSLSLPLQVWKPKLERAFPTGCLPGLYGSESWRDLAILYFVWGREWSGKVRDETCEVSCAEDGIGASEEEDAEGRRDLVGVVWPTYEEESVPSIFFLNGDVLYQVDESRIRSGNIFLPQTDGKVFLGNGITSLDAARRCRRTAYIPLRDETIHTAHVQHLPSGARHITDIDKRLNTSICGNVCVHHDDRRHITSPRKIFITDLSTTPTSSPAASFHSPPALTNRDTSPPVFNETMVATKKAPPCGTITNNSNCPMGYRQITLTRIEDSHPVATFHVLKPLTDRAYGILTRTHFLWFRVGRTLRSWSEKQVAEVADASNTSALDVYDIQSSELLYTLTLPSRGDVEYCGDDSYLIFWSENRDERPILIDARKGCLRRLSAPDAEGFWVIIREYSIRWCGGRDRVIWRYRRKEDMVRDGGVEKAMSWAQDELEIEWAEDMVLGPGASSQCEGSDKYYEEYCLLEGQYTYMKRENKL